MRFYPIHENCKFYKIVLSSQYLATINIKLGFKPLYAQLKLLKVEQIFKLDVAKFMEKL